MGIQLDDDNSLWFKEQIVAKKQLDGRMKVEMVPCGHFQDLRDSELREAVKTGIAFCAYCMAPKLVKGDDIHRFKVEVGISP